MFEIALRDGALATYRLMHSSRQELMAYHVHNALPVWIAQGQRRPDDLQAAEVSEHLSVPHVILCLTTFKRNWQIKLTLEINVQHTWHWRSRVTWVIVDFNEDMEVSQWIVDKMGFALRVGHIILLRPVKPWKVFHSPMAKNTAHMAGLGHFADDRIQAAQGAGLTADDMLSDVFARAFLVNIDNDNFITLRWLHSAMRVAETVCSDKNRQSVQPLIGAQLQNKEAGTCG